MIDISTIVKSINKEATIETELTLTSFESRLGDYPILKSSRYHFISQTWRMQQCTSREQ